MGALLKYKWFLLGGLVLWWYMRQPKTKTLESYGFYSVGQGTLAWQGDKMGPP